MSTRRARAGAQSRRLQTPPESAADQAGPGGRACKPSEHAGQPPRKGAPAESKRTAPGRRRKRAAIGTYWENFSTRELLDLRLCDLGVSLENTWVEEALQQVHQEMADRGLKPLPHAWLADEWCSPDGVPGIGVPFYLVHPRLMKLERSRMLECEGGSWKECLMLLRHEAGHAMQHAFQLERRRRWQQQFGRASMPYPDGYRPNPGSKRYVQHLDGWYAQSHPVEDFAETFAVWLDPRSRWQRVYQDWPALKKLEYVDELMAELAGAKPKVRSRARPFSLGRNRTTLRDHYAQRKAHYTPSFAGTYDKDLRNLFDADARQGESAAKFLRRHRRDIRKLVARWTGEYTFTVDQVMKGMIGRCSELKLRVQPQASTHVDFAIVLTKHAMTYVHWVREMHAV